MARQSKGGASSLLARGKSALEKNNQYAPAVVRASEDGEVMRRIAQIEEMQSELRQAAVDVGVPGVEVELVESNPSDNAGADPIGLDSALGSPSDNDAAPTREATAGMQMVRLSDIYIPGINVRVIDEESDAFLNLVDSVREHGILQPLLVGVDEGRVWLIAGERRYRAARAVGLDRVPVNYTSEPPPEWRTLMLVENLQRDELTPWEEARGFQELQSLGLTIDRIAERVGVGKSHISTILKLIKNPEVLRALQERRIHHRTLAEELGPLINRRGVERWPGVVEKALDFITAGPRTPTASQLRMWVQQVVAAEGVVKERGRGRRGPAARPTFLRVVEKQLATEFTKIGELSRMEVEMLAAAHQRHAEALRAALSNGEGDSERV